MLLPVNDSPAAIGLSHRGRLIQRTTAGTPVESTAKRTQSRYKRVEPEEAPSNSIRTGPAQLLRPPSDGRHEPAAGTVAATTSETSESHLERVDTLMAGYNSIMGLFTCTSLPLSCSTASRAAVRS